MKNTFYVAAGLVVAIIIAGVVAIAVMISHQSGPDKHNPVVTVETPQEDEPGWNCRIHGNKQCGGVWT